MAIITRRLALKTGLLGSVAACSSTPTLTAFEALSSQSTAVFAHGVASGDPTQDGIVLWTRISLPETNPQAIAVSVDVELATDLGFSDIVATKTVATGPERDWTVKHIAEGLLPGTSYFYRFKAGEAISPIGQTKTLPEGSVAEANFAVISCSNYPFGYFNVYDQIARQEGLDAVIHLGDYFYEYGADGYGGESGAALGRPHAPSREIISLTDYRERHAQYKSDPSAQAMHAAHAFIAIWDDHETANNSWKDGAQNHQDDTEGNWEDRKNAALRAYYEWMPVRDPAPGRAAEDLFKAYSFGDLLTLAAIETRLTARSAQFEYNEIVPTLKSPEDIENFRSNTLWDSSREMLGQAQIDYLDRSFRQSKEAGQPWRLIANQVIMAEVTAPDLTPHVTEEEILELEKQWDQARAFVQFSKLGLPTNLDAWDGYPAARERFYDTLKNAEADDGLIVLTGDTHTWWANDLSDRNGTHMGVELGVNSVTSPSPYRKSFLGGKGAEYALLTNQKNKSVRYLSGEDHGFIYLTMTPEKVVARFEAVDTVEAQQYSAFEKVAFTVKRNATGKAKFSGTNGLTFKENFLF